MNKEDEEILDMKKIDSFLIVISNNSMLSNDRRPSNTSILSHQNSNVSFNIGELAQPARVERENNHVRGQQISKEAEVAICKKKSRIFEKIKNCEKMRIKCQTLLRNPSPKKRPLSSDEIQEHLLKKKNIRYLNYTQEAEKVEGFSPVSSPKNRKSQNEIKNFPSFPQLRIQPRLLTIYSQNCQHFSLLKVINKTVKIQTFLCQQLNSKSMYSMKMFKKELLTGKDQDILIQEWKKQMFLTHPNIIKLHGIIKDKQFIYALYQPAMHQDLSQKLKENGFFSQKDVRSIIKQVCSALEYMHKNDILHLKLRLENVYLQDNVAKISGFQQALCLPLLRREKLSSFIQQKALKQKCGLLDTKKDIWDIGIMTYELLFGKLPIFVQHPQGASDEAGVYFSEEVTVSAPLRDFIEGCLRQNPYKRYSMRQMSEHPFLKGADKYRWTTL